MVHRAIGAKAGGFLLAIACACATPSVGARAQDFVVGAEKIADAKLYAAAKKEGRFTLYGVIPSDIYHPIVEAFEKDSGIKVDFVRLTTQALYARVTAEFAAGKLAGDFVDLSDPVLLKEFMDKGILAKPVKVLNFDKLPPTVRDPQGRWYAEIRQINALGVNTAVVKTSDFPKRWTDLLDRKWANGKIGMGSIDAGGAHFIAQSFLREKIGKDFWNKLAAQKPRVYSSAAPVMTNLARGEVSLAFAAAATVLGQIANGDPLAVIFPSEGVASFFVGGGVTATAANPSAAALFLNWVTSVRGGAVISGRGVYASNPASPLPTAPGVTFPGLDQVWGLDVDSWTAEREAISAEWRATFNVK
jgi:iron(III) transport system substrate-binding protein